MELMEPMETHAFPTGSSATVPARKNSGPALIVFAVVLLLGAALPLRGEETRPGAGETLVAMDAAAGEPIAAETEDATGLVRYSGLSLQPCGSGEGAVSSSHTFSFAMARTADTLQPEGCFSFAAESELLPEPGAIAPVELPRRAERFQWNPALKQSFRFLLLQHGFRIAMDRDARWMLLHKPFWHDYFASFKNSEWGAQWGDGDNFLVNYIGHPLQGAVSSNIYLQNDPSARGLKFSNTQPYWNSRLKAMGWSAVYSILFESGPVLSETAIGNQGGYMYVPGCGYYPTCEKEPGRNYKPPTNNTGWVDRVITPTVGTGWVVLEDVLEANVVDRLANGSSAMKFKVLRATLAPSRSLANILAGHMPWFRYPASGGRSEVMANAILPADGVPDWRQERRFAVGLHFAELSLPRDREGCNRCRRYNPGVGLDFEYRLSRLVYFDSQYALFPGSGDEGEPGRAHEMLFGIKFGRRFGSWGLFTQARPGFIHYEKTLVPGTTNRYESVTRFAFDLGGTAEYHTSARSIVRFRMGSTFVRYLKDTPDPNQPPVSVLSSSVINTQGNFYATSGYLFRF